MVMWASTGEWCATWGETNSPRRCPDGQCCLLAYAHVTGLLSPAAKPALVEASPAGYHGQVCASMSLGLGGAPIHTFHVSQQGPGSRDSH